MITVPEDKRQKGAGLIEVLIALFLLSLTFSALHIMQLGNRKVLSNLEGRNFAMVAAQEVMDSLRLVGAPAIVGATAENPGIRNFTQTIVTGEGASVIKNVRVQYSIENTISETDQLGNTIIKTHDIRVESQWQTGVTPHSLTFNITVN
ncbi:MAG: prepilin-type N-terminal cleavage/methylation domain-containing protein [Fibrobacterales bacterium]